MVTPFSLAEGVYIRLGGKRPDPLSPAQCRNGGFCSREAAGPGGGGTKWEIELAPEGRWGNESGCCCTEAGRGAFHRRAVRGPFKAWNG